MKRIAILGLNKPVEGNFLHMGRILSANFKLDLIGGKSQTTNMRKIFTVKSHSKIIGRNLLTWFLRDIRNLWSYCRSEKPDVLCSLQRPDFQGPLVVLFGKLFGIRTVVRFSGSRFDYYKYVKGVKKMLTYISHNGFMRLLKYSDTIICMGDEQKKELLRIGANPKKIKILLQPTDQELFKPAKNRKNLRKLLKLPDKKIILFVGAIVKYKGIDSLVNLADNLNDEYYFILIGQDRDNYEDKFKQKTNNFKIIPHMSQDELVKYYQASDLLVHPSYIEGFPKTVLEASACGLPVIARDIMDVGRIANQVFTSDQELVSKVISLRLKNNGKSRLNKKYSWKSLTKQYIKVFK